MSLQFRQPKISRKVVNHSGPRSKELEGQSLDMMVYTHTNTVNFYNSIKEFAKGNTLLVSISFADKGSTVQSTDGSTITTTDYYSPVLIFMTPEQAEAQKDILTWTVNKELCNTASVSVVSGKEDSFTALFNPSLVDYTEYVLSEDDITELDENGEPVGIITKRLNSLAFTVIDEITLTGVQYEKAYLLEQIGEVAPTADRIRKVPAGRNKVTA